MKNGEGLAAGNLDFLPVSGSVVAFDLGIEQLQPDVFGHILRAALAGQPLFIFLPSRALFQLVGIVAF